MRRKMVNKNKFVFNENERLPPPRVISGISAQSRLHKKANNNLAYNDDFVGGGRQASENIGRVLYNAQKTAAIVSTNYVRNFLQVQQIVKQCKSLDQSCLCPILPNSSLYLTQVIVLK